MLYRRRLRSRIILSFLLLGFGLTALFAVATLLLRARLENQLIGQALTANLDEYAASFYKDPNLQGVPFAKIEGYTFSKRRFGNVPFEWQDLPDGVHELTESDGHGGHSVYKLAVRKDAEFWFFLKYDTTQEQRSQELLQYALPVVVLAFSALSLILGFWASARVISPVRELASRLRGLRDAEHPAKQADSFADDEVGELAAALDEYAARLTEVVRRDREFNADVSHELRTPLAVIRGATELLLAQPDLPQRTRQRLLRIDRAAQQCSDLTTALLMLSRNERGTGRTELRRLLEGLIEAGRIQLHGKPVAMRLEGEAEAIVAAPEAVLAVALGNLIGNACKYTAEGEVVVRLERDRVSVEDTGGGIAVEEAALLFERGYRGRSAGGTKGGGIGLAIVRRLCDLYGWKVSLAPRGERGTVAVLVFG